MKLRALTLLLVAMAPVACTGTPSQPPLRSLRGSSDTALLCLAEITDPEGEEGPSFLPRPLTSCPDFNSDDGEARTLYSVVAQRETGEVALVDLENSEVVDSEIAIPGISFVPVGAEPVSIVSTPGGVASFVAVREPGKEGIYALPTSCMGTRASGEQPVDITSWPACSLPAAPGAMEVLIDRGVDDDGDPLTPVLQRVSCDAAPSADAVIPGVSPGATRANCPADLALETAEPGRRKLLVALPSLGQLVLIDAQALLDREQGSFGECPVERTLQLVVDLPATKVAQELPEDLPAAIRSCEFPTYNHGPRNSTLPRPVDFAKSDEKLYVADLDAPVIHVLDTRDPCALSEEAPLLPMSFTEPSAMITTRRVAISPLTSKRDRFLYAIDESPTRTAGSVMIFDVSDDSTERTPLVRPRSALLPQEPPDRIQFAQEAVDVEFVDHRIPVVDSVTGVATDGVFCNPGGSSSAVAAQYRPNADLTSGAGPARLRGVFAFVGLYSGQVVVVDVEDLDAPCRRPTSVNTGATEDFRGCSGDRNADYANPQTVSGEISCKVVEPHRARSASFFINETSTTGRGASLRQFPRLTSNTGRLLPTDQSDDGKNSPILLGVDFAAGDRPAELFVGATRYSHDPDAENELVLDPARAERSSLTLSFEEPRVFLPNEQFTLTYEGLLGDAAFASFEHAPGSEFGVINEGVNGRFCSHGVQDVAATREFAERFLPAASAGERNEFVSGHADYVQLNSDFPAEDSNYWQSAEGSQCGSRLPREDQSVQALTGHRFCELWFGSPEVPTTRRDLRIREAYENRVVVEPRRGLESPELLMDLVACCFPEPMTYQVRAGQQWILQGSQSGFQHNMSVEAASGRCIHDCNPLKARQNARALEISCNGEESCFGEGGQPIIGLATDTSQNGKDVACVIADPTGGVRAEGDGGECIFRGLNTSFAVYRGRSPSVRDMRFNWQLRGGFNPLTIGLSRAADAVPERLRFVPNMGLVLVADGGTSGLSLISLRDLLRTTIN